MMTRFFNSVFQYLYYLESTNSDENFCYIPNDPGAGHGP